MSRIQTVVRVFFVVFAVFLGEFSLFSLNYLSEPPVSRILDNEARLAQPFLIEATARRLSGKLEEADQWAKRGLELDPNCADLLLLRADIILKTGLPLPESIQFTRAALKSGRWITGQYADAFLQLIDLLFINHDYKAAFQEFEQRFGERDILRDPRLSSRKIAVLQHLGKLDAANLLAEAALNAWPDDPAIMASCLEFQPQSLTLHRWFDRFHDTSADYRRALFWYAASLPVGQERLKRCNEYLALGGDNTEVYPWALESALENNAADSLALCKDWGQRFLLNRKVNLDAASKLYSLISDASFKQIFWQSLATGTIQAYRDFDNDGYPEETFEFSNGVIQTWTVDYNQDHLQELSVLWSGGKIQGLIQANKNQVIHAVYASYPELAHVEVAENGHFSDLQIPHGRMEARVLDIPQIGWIHPLQSLEYLDLKGQNITLNLAQIQKITDQITVFDSATPAHRVVKQTKMEKGLALASREDTDADGVFDYLLWFDKGQASMGFRDIENSGAFDAVELWLGGKLAEFVHIDQDSQLSYRLDRVHGLASWDINHDGKIDINESRIANKTIIQQFSSRLDGFFDIVAENGVIKSILLPSFATQQVQK